MSTGRATNLGRTIVILLIGGVFGFAAGAILAVLRNLEPPSPLLASVPGDAVAVVQVRTEVSADDIRALVPMLPERLLPPSLPADSVWALVPDGNRRSPLLLTFSAIAGPAYAGWSDERAGTIRVLSPSPELLASWETAERTDAWRRRFQPIGVRRRAAQALAYGYVDASLLDALNVVPGTDDTGAYVALHGRGTDARLVIDQHPRFLSMPLRFPSPPMRALDAAAYDIVLSGQNMGAAIMDEHLIGTDPFFRLLGTVTSADDQGSLFSGPVSIGIRTGASPVVTLLWSARSPRNVSARQEAAARLVDRAAQLHAPIAEPATLSDGSSVQLLRPRPEPFAHQRLVGLTAGWQGWAIIFASGEEWRVAWDARGTILVSTDPGAFVQALGSATARRPRSQPACQTTKGPSVITVKLPLFRKWFPGSPDLPDGREKDAFAVLESGWRPDLATICVR
ncbi:MAG: hypothetical protein HY341_01980 [Candidatus Kerfeldbacteria bacterium]|nr:hypothetical protein [Candidatus Kerfeldbacteria bacterium]